MKRLFEGVPTRGWVLGVALLAAGEREEFRKMASEGNPIDLTAMMHLLGLSDLMSPHDLRRPRLAERRVREDESELPGMRADPLTRARLAEGYAQVLHLQKGRHGVPMVNDRAPSGRAHRAARRR